MSSVFHRTYRDMAPSFEALLQEFVNDPLGLRPEDRLNRQNKLLGYFQKIYDRAKQGSKMNSALRIAYDETRKWAQNVFVQHHRRKTFESSIDYPHDTLDPSLWDNIRGTYKLKVEIKNSILNILNRYPTVNLLSIAKEIHIVGSSATNTYQESSDLDVHIIPDLNILFEVLKKFASGSSETEQKTDFAGDVKDWSHEHKILIGSHPLEIYIQFLPDQDLLGDAVYNLETDMWIKGPKIEKLDYDPYAVFKFVLHDIHEMVRDTDIKIGELKRNVIDYHVIKDAIHRLPSEYHKKLLDHLNSKLEEIEKDIDSLLKDKKEWIEMRHNSSKPKSTEEALKSFELSKKWQKANATFKLLDRYHYIRLITDLEELVNDQKLDDEDVSKMSGLLGIGGKNVR